MSETLLFLSHDASRTGAPIMLLNLLRWIRQNRNVDFRILTGRPGELTADFAAVGLVDSFEPSGGLWYKIMRRFHMQCLHDSNHLMRLRREFLSVNINLIYVNSIASAKILEFLSFVDCPVICHVHELDGAIRATGIENVALLEKRRPLYIAVSHAVKKNLAKNHGIPMNRIQVIHGFVPRAQTNAMELEKARRKICKRLGICEKAKLVFACGSIEPRKGTDLFIQVAEKVVRECSYPVHFIWAGGTPKKVRAVRSQIANSMLREVVHFVGHTPDTNIYFEACEIFLLTSREDPFPLVMMEAAQHAKPIVCFECAGGAPEFVEADAGFIIPAFDVLKMSQKVVELLSSQVLCSRVGHAAKYKIANLYDIDIGAAKVADCIEAAI